MASPYSSELGGVLPRYRRYATMKEELPLLGNGLDAMDLRFRLLLLTLVGLIAVAVWTFPSWRVYFRQRGENDAFPGLDIDLQDEFLALPRAEREALLDMRERSPNMALEMVMVNIADDELAPQDDSAAAIQAARALASGEFQALNALFWGAGRATILELPDARRILRFEDFISAPGSNPRVYLARDPQPLSALQLEGASLDLGRLKGNVGDQNYFLPDDHDLSVYQSAVVFCVRFNTTITVARLR